MAGGLLRALAHPVPAALAADGHALWMGGHAYWMVWRHAVHGLAPSELDPYPCSPAFAQVPRPLTLLPFPAFAAVSWGGTAAVLLALLPGPPSLPPGLPLAAVPRLVAVGRATPEAGRALP